MDNLDLERELHDLVKRAMGPLYSRVRWTPIEAEISKTISRLQAAALPVEEQGPRPVDLETLIPGLLELARSEPHDDDDCPNDDTCRCANIAQLNAEFKAIEKLAASRPKAEEGKAEPRPGTDGGPDLRDDMLKRAYRLICTGIFSEDGGDVDAGVEWVEEIGRRMPWIGNGWEACAECEGDGCEHCGKTGFLNVPVGEIPPSAAAQAPTAQSAPPVEPPAPRPTAESTRMLAAWKCLRADLEGSDKWPVGDTFQYKEFFFHGWISCAASMEGRNPDGTPFRGIAGQPKSAEAQAGEAP